MTDETPAAVADAPVVDTPDVPETPVEETVPKAQTDALRRELAEEQRARKRLEEQQKKAKEDQAAEQGKWQELAQQRESELATEREERSRVEREARIGRLAAKAKFLDPTDVIGRVSAEEGADDASVEAALERIAERSPHLIAKEAPAVPEIGQVLTPSAAPQTTGPTPPPGKAPLRTQADVEALSDKEFEERYAEVQAVLTAPQ